MNTWRGSGWQFSGAGGAREMKASGCWGLQFRVTTLTNRPFIVTQEWSARRRFNLSSHGHIRGLGFSGNSGRLCLMRWQGIPLQSSEIQTSSDFLCFSKSFSEGPLNVNQFQQELCTRGMITAYDCLSLWSLSRSKAFRTAPKMWSHLIRFTPGNHSKTMWA